MGIFKLKGYSGEAEILGALREVEFSKNCLIIDDITIQECNEILSVLAIGEVAGKQPGGVTARAIDTQLRMGPAEELPSDPHPAADNEEFDTKAVSPLGSDSVGVKDSVEAVTEASDPEPQGTVPGDTEEEAKAEQAASETPPKRKRGRPRKTEQSSESKENQETKESSSSDGGNGKRDWVSGEGENPKSVAGVSDKLMKELQEQTRIRDVLICLSENGFSTKQALVEVCMNLVDFVPCLTKASKSQTKDLKNERLPRIIESIGIED
jgi:hypothetical protein